MVAPVRARDGDRRGGRAGRRAGSRCAALRNARLASPGLYPVATLATAGLAFGGAATLHGSGFLAAYLAGLVLGSARIPAKQTVTVFHEGLAWVAQIAMFLALGLLVFPSELGDVWLEGTALALMLVFIARPLTAALATAFEPLHRRRSAWCSAGRGCAARCRWCSRPSR